MAEYESILKKVLLLDLLDEIQDFNSNFKPETVRELFFSLTQYLTLIFARYFLSGSVLFAIIISFISGLNRDLNLTPYLIYAVTFFGVSFLLTIILGLSLRPLKYISKKDRNKVQTMFLIVSLMQLLFSLAIVLPVVYSFSILLH